MKKESTFKIIILIASFIFLVASGFSQTSACQYSTCVPVIKFGSSDALQNYGMLKNILNAINSPTGTNSFQDNSVDTLNNRLKRVMNALYSSNIPIADWSVSQDSKLNSIVNQNALLAPNTVTLSVTSLTASSNGTISSGYKSISFFTSNSFSGSINGIPREKNTFYSFSTPQTNAVLNSIIYVISTGSISIDLIQ